MEETKEPVHQFVICPACGWKNLRTDVHCSKCDRVLPNMPGPPSGPTIDEIAQKATIADLYREIAGLKKESASGNMFFTAIAATALGVGLLVIVVGSPIFAAIVAALSIILGIALLFQSSGN